MATKLRRVEKIYYQKKKNKKTMMRLVVSLPGEDKLTNVYSQCDDTQHDTLEKRLAMLYGKFKKEHEDILDDLKEVFSENHGVPGFYETPSKGDESVFTLDDDKSTGGGNIVVVTSNVLLVDFEMKLCADKVSWKLPQKTRAEIKRYCVVPFTSP